MRRLRILTIIPLVAGLLFAGAATTAAQSGAPVIPSVPGMGDLPFVDAGFPCSWPQLRDLAPTTVSDNINATHDSFVFLMPSTPAVPSQPGPIMGQGMDLSFMKCFFHYPSGAEGQSRTLKDQVICAYPPDHFAGPTNPQDHNHVFAHSTLIVRDMFAILLCWGTAQSG